MGWEAEHRGRMLSARRIVGAPSLSYRGVHSFAMTRVHAAPVITHVEALLTPEEVNHMIMYAYEHDLFKRSTGVVDGANRVVDGRTSHSALIPKGDSDSVVARIEDRMCTLSGMPRDYMEPLQIVRYSKDQEYRPHHDYFDGTPPRQRTLTIFVYLKTVSTGCGGGTLFPNLKDDRDQPLRFKPKAGDGLMWANMLPDGNVDPLTLHSGEKVTCDEIKYGLNVWFGNRKV